jgi:hypothetical protein
MMTQTLAIKQSAVPEAETPLFSFSVKTTYSSD